MALTLIAGLLIIASAGAFLYYFRPSKVDENEERLIEQKNELDDLIKRTRKDYYKRRIDQNEANKSVREYEIKVRQINKKLDLIEAIREHSTEKIMLDSRQNQYILATVLVIVGVILIGLNFLPEEADPIKPPII